MKYCKKITLIILLITIGFTASAQKDSLSIQKKDSILLSSKVLSLPEIEVKPKEELVRISLEKTVYHASWDPLNRNMTALDVLRNTPMVMVEGTNISLRGYIPVILLNNEEYPMLLNNPGDFLASQPASLIHQVELLSMPSIKYKGRPVINLVVKQIPKYSYSGTVESSISEQGSISKNSYGNIVFDKFSSNVGIGGGWSNGRNTRSSFNSESKVFDRNTRSEITSNRSSSYNLYANYMGAYTFNANQKLDFSLRAQLGGTDKPIESTNLHSEFKRDGTIMKEYETLSREPVRDNNSYSAQMRYSHKLKSDPEKVLKFSYSSQWNDSRSVSQMQTTGIVNYPNKKEESKHKGGSGSHRLDVEYYQPVTGKGELRSGASYLLREQEKVNFRYDFDMNNIPTVLDDYTDNTHSSKESFNGYVSFLWKLSRRVMIKTGGSADYYFDSHENRKEQNKLSDKYFSLTPTLSAAILLKNQNRLNISYSFSSDRPSLSQMDASTVRIGENSYSSGNPNLGSIKTHRLSFRMENMIGYNINLMNSLDIDQTIDGVTSFAEMINDSTFFHTYKNAENRLNIGFTGYESISLAQNKIRLSVQFSARYSRIKKEFGEIIDGIQWGGNLSMSYSYNRQLSFAGSLSAIDNQLEYQTKQKRQTSHFLKMNYSPSLKWSFSLHLRNIFRPTIYNRSITDTDTFYSQSEHKRNNFGVQLTAQFRFNGDVKQKRIK